jgi:aspartyl-tRNA(Asn)/glutamyl-tRNA(Gln) amidotransferase subunit B
MEGKYHPTIGLEVHAELATRTKMFCDSLNDPEETRPNINVCPVCLGHPGSLPTINRKAVEHVIKVGLALGSIPNAESRFDRKNYFYPDLPKAYQISQSGMPLVVGGTLRGIKINHIHLEEDAGKLVHGPSNASGQATGDKEDFTLVDYNRSSVPLMELVTEPDIHSAEDAVAFMKELQLILRYLGVSDADLERGQMRADANISVSPNDKLGTRAEVKNLNSFRSVFAAINYEIKRQTEMLEKGETVRQETRGWDDAKQKTTSQRSKEEAQDYRYFPEPDLPPFSPAQVLSDKIWAGGTSVSGIEALRASIPELPAAKRVRLQSEYALSESHAEFLVQDPQLAGFFEEAVSELKESDEGQVTSDKERESGMKLLYNYLTSDLRGMMNESGVRFADVKISPEHLAHLVQLIDGKKITSRQAKDILVRMFDTGLDPEDIVRDENIGATSDTGEIEPVLAAIIAENPAAAADYKKGKTASLQFLIGKAMGKLKGSARPDALKEIFERLLK